MAYANKHRSPVAFNAPFRNGTVKLRIPAPNRLQNTAKDMPTSREKVSRSLGPWQVELTPIHEREYFCAVCKWDRTEPRGVKHSIEDYEQCYQRDVSFAVFGGFECKACGQKRER
jgi:hypothetical protein